jgi:ATP-dependent helicase/nuclease subunit A
MNSIYYLLEQSVYSLDNPLLIYRSSAGSGKTRTLSKEYIRLALQNPDHFGSILAVTFTNKATQEMKDRIVYSLHAMSNGKANDLVSEIAAEDKRTEPEVRQRSQEVLSKILHRYSSFSISTIDAFFQRVIRAFTRESGLLGNFRLEADNDRVLHEVIAELMDELGQDLQLTDWVIQFSKNRLQEGEAWNIIDALRVFALEIFKDTFKVIEEGLTEHGDKEAMKKTLATLQRIQSEFLEAMKTFSGEAVRLLEDNGITVDDFNFKNQGTAFKYFREFHQGRYFKSGERVRGSATDARSWASKNSPRARQLVQLAQDSLMPILQKMIRYEDEHSRKYKSAALIEENFYSYGLISDISRKLKEYKAENNLMLLSDSAHFLHGIINQSDTPFIYEKVGSYYRHYLIDEFQDTSHLQWSNFEPLVQESLDQHHKNVIVGDVKQSIYRWRGSDQALLDETIKKERTSGISEFVLEDNWRSAGNLVVFNNALFSAASAIVSSTLGQSRPTEIFKDVKQKPVKFPGKGFVRIRFFENWRGTTGESGLESALLNVTGVLEELQEKGIALKDIAILVRRNEEGQRIAAHLLQYKNSPSAKPGMRYDVVSNESLRLDASSCVLLLISSIRYIHNPEDAIARGEVTYELSRRTKNVTPEEMESRLSQAGKKGGEDLFPGKLATRLSGLAGLSLFETTETIIRLFRLGEETQELVYLQAFQDLILEFSSQEKNDLSSFLDWWEEVKEKRSIQASSNTEAASIYSIHKAKGLQFKYVIVPFCSWKLDHEIAPLLWSKSNEKPFDEMGFLAVRYSSELENSVFSKAYEDEKVKTYIDNLNLLYVAFTRAEEGLIVMAPKLESKPSLAGHLVYEAIQATDSLRPHYHSQTNEFLLGAMENLNPTHENQSQSILLHRYMTFDWRKKIVIKREGTEFFAGGKSMDRQRINQGILMHRVLSLVHYKQDVDEVLHRLNREGIVMDDEVATLTATFKKMMDHPLIGNWFSTEWQIKTEVPVIIPGGKEGRLDRVIFKDQKRTGHGKATIIDYKTGKKKSEDRRQVEEYAGILSGMGYSDVEAFLLYLDNLEVVPVINKMNLNLF